MNLGPAGALGHPSWRTAIGTIVSYAVILLAMFFLLFVVPYLLFWPF